MSKGGARDRIWPPLAPDAPRPVGMLLKGRYRITQRLISDGPTLCYAVTDFYVPGREFEARQYSVPSAAPGVWEHVQRGVEAEHRTISWLQVPGLVLPRDLFAEDGCVWVVEGAAQGERLDLRLMRRGADLEEIVRWVGEACELVGTLHTALARPFVLGRLSEASFVISPEGRLQLAGFQLDHDFRLRFRIPPRSESWQAPDSFPTPASDIWLLGNLLERLLAEADETLRNGPTQGRMEQLPRRVRNGREAVEAVIRRARAEAPADRYASPIAFKRDLNRILRQLPGRTPKAWRGEARAHALPWRERFPVVAAMLPYAAALLLLSLLAAGLAQMQVTMRSLGAGLRSTPLAAVATLPPGTEVWVEGTVEPIKAETPLTSPLTGAPSVAFDSRLEREMTREVWDGEEKRYRVAIYPQVVLRRARAVPFVLRDGATSVRVDPGVAEILGPHLEVSQVPDTTDKIQIPRLRVGEKVRSIHGRESRVAAQERVYVRACVEQENGRVVLKRPTDTQVIIYKGSWSGYVAHVGLAMLPGALMVLASLAAMGLAGARLRQALRPQQPWARRAAVA